MIDLPTIWFALVGVLIAGYAVLDGFDLGVGVLHLFLKGEKEHRIALNSIGPVWDGNEVWLLTGGGALFAAFPAVYATVFSGFYLALMLLLVALIARAVALEFRGKVESESWKGFWDKAFGIGSLLPAVLLGVAVGNILRGVPIDAKGAYVGTFLQLLNPYSVVVGLVSLSFMVMHGAIYLALKSEGDLHSRMLAIAGKVWMAFVGIYFVATVWSIAGQGHLFQDVFSAPLFWVFLLLLIAAIGTIPVFLKRGDAFKALLASSAAIIAMIGVSAVSLFPRLVPSSIDLANSLTIANSSSSAYTQKIMLIIALIGMPIVIAYTFIIYRSFKGKVSLDEASY